MSLAEGIPGKVLALALAALFIGAIYIAAAAPLFSYYLRLEQRLQDRQQLAQRYQALARDLPSLRAQTSRRLGESASAELLWTGSSDAVSAAMLQSSLKELVERERAKLTSAEMLPSEPVDDIVRRVGVRIAFFADLKLLTSVINEIETTHPVLSIKNLDIHSANASQTEVGDRALAIAMDVYGFLPR
jgi:hypothetical protein